MTGSFNLIGTGGSGGIVGGTDGNIALSSLASLGLASLGDYGGPAETVARLPGSAAIGVGTAVSGITTDERGFSLDTPPDIGAFQTQTGPLVVNTTADGVGSPSGDLSLRQAINLANVLATAETITFDPAVFSTAQTITLTDGSLALSNTAASVAIDGPGAGLLSVSGDNTTEVFNTADDTVVSMSGLSIIDGNGVFGGGLFNDGMLTITDTTFAGNTGIYGGALYTRAGGSDPLNGVVTLTGDTFTGNTATALSGALDNWAGGTVTVTDDTFTGNSAPSGGAIGNEWGSVNVSNSTFSDNTASTGAGGAIINDNPDDYFSNSLSVVGSTISGNVAVNGGGIANGGPDTMSLTNDTITGNSVTGNGGGLYSNGTTTLSNCTVTGNSANEGGGLYNFGLASATVTDTIVAGDAGGDGPSDISGSQANQVTGSFNLVGTGGSGGLTDGVGGNIVLTSLADLGLAPLGDYGGPTQTIGLLPGSPAIGAGTAVYGVIADERGEPLDAPNPDIGAFQSQGFTLTPAVGSTPQSAEIGTPFAYPLAVTVAANNPVEPVAGGVLTFATPTSGASANLSASTATIGSDGVASVTAAANSSAGSYTVTASLGGDTADFALNNTVPLIGLTFSGIGNQSITYGTSTVTISGTLANGSRAPVGESVAVSLGGVEQSATIGSGGAFSITFNDDGLTVASSPDTVNYAYTSDGTFASGSTTSTLTIAPATLMITADPETKVYGTADPALAYSVTGFQFADTAAMVLTGALARTEAGTLVGEQAGGYAITQGTLAADSNYTIEFTGNTLTIIPSNLTVTANPRTKVYGTNDPTLTLTPTGLVDTTVDGVAINDTSASTLAGALVRAQSGSVAGERVGDYPITQGTLAADSNYTMTFTGNSLTITPASLTVSANSQSKVYGTNDPSLSDTATGFVDTTVDGVKIDDTAATELSGHMARAAGETAAGGPYAITQGTLAADSDYTMSFISSTLTITPATLTIAAEPETKVYGSADPPLAYTASGFQFSDTEATVLTGQLARAAGETVSGSPYAIGQGTLAADSNYTIHLTGSSLSITAATPILTVSDPGGSYNGSPMAATAAVAGVGGTAAASLEGVTPILTYYTGSGTTGANLGSTAPSAVGAYTVVARFPGSADYVAAQSQPATFVITPTSSNTSKGAATVTLTSTGGSAVYGQAVTFVATVSSGGTPGGMVTFSDDGTPLATVPLDGSGRATLTISTLPPGSNAITATYDDNGDSLGAKSGSTTESVSRASTAIVLVSHPILKGKKKLEAVGLTVQIKPAATGGGVPTGQVTFEFVKKHRNTVKVKMLGNAALVGGEATLTFRPKQVLKKPLTIVYSGDPDFLASTTSPPKLTEKTLT